MRSLPGSLADGVLADAILIPVFSPGFFEGVSGGGGGAGIRARRWEK